MLLTMVGGIPLCLTPYFFTGFAHGLSTLPADSSFAAYALPLFVTGFASIGRAIAERLRGGADMSLRISCPEIVQRDYLPALMSAVRKRVPDFPVIAFYALTMGCRSPMVKLFVDQVKK